MKFILVAAVVLMAGCGLTPEQKLERGFSSVEATAIATTRLLDAEVISSTQAKRVFTIGTISHGSLVDGERKLIECRAAGNKDCDNAVSEIDLGSDMLLQLERFLEEQEAN